MITTAVRCDLNVCNFRQFFSGKKDWIWHPHHICSNSVEFSSKYSVGICSDKILYPRLATCIILFGIHPEDLSILITWLRLNRWKFPFHFHFKFNHINFVTIIIMIMWSEVKCWKNTILKSKLVINNANWFEALALFLPFGSEVSYPKNVFLQTLLYLRTTGAMRCVLRLFFLFIHISISF